ncbi:MAG: DUF262 domain-containing protein [Parvibaculum sedimenti]|uniref:GmrSD restriction endonuclease domain-containing protein n=1 Tax=Parvibaculum sedimenti TaxID=2608632 RepID=UPI003BB57DD7
MAQRVNLDAMIPREDFAREIKGATTAPRNITELKLSDLLPDAAIRRQLRKPEFQRETNHWKPDQVVKLITSFLDEDVIPSIILWRSANFIFVIDGAHRLSALCAWIQDDYGFGTASKTLYSDEISDEQKRVDERVRKMIKSVGTYADLDRLVGKAAPGKAGERAGAMNTQPIIVQTVKGTAKAAEDSFFAINKQGTALDETEEYLIRNRHKPISIGARAIVRAGSGHPYWSSYSQANQEEVVRLAKELHRILFEPEVTSPLKTLDLPLAGSKSPVDALAVLLDFLTVADPRAHLDKMADDPSLPKTDESGTQTIEALKNGLKIAHRVTGNSGESLGLHPAVYFSNDKGKHSRFLFLGMCALVAERLRNNDDNWFRKFTKARKGIETFLIANKSVIGIVLQNLGKKTRIPRMQQMFRFLVEECSKGEAPDTQTVFSHIGLRGKIYDVTAIPRTVTFSDDTKSQIYYRTAIETAQKCPICSGLIDVTKSVSYDHITRVRDGGLGAAENGQMVHPYCNTAMKG